MAVTPSDSFLTPDAMRQHWQGHRRLTRRTIEAFPADTLFTFAVGGMRTFGELANEMLGMAAPTIEGLISDDWSAYAEAHASTQADVLRAWDATTTTIDSRWAAIPVAHFQEVVTAFGRWTMPAHELVLYLVDNEIHHRGQGFVYLRALGIEPPHFWERE